VNRRWNRHCSLGRKAWLGVVLCALTAPAIALAQDLSGILAPSPAGGTQEASSFGAVDLMQGWDTFLHGWRLLDMAIVFLLAALLGAVIAYHPRTRAKASTLPELEQPKTFIMYALVGAVTAKIVEANSAMAFVVFGIGGLMRFRTDVGPAKDTGRVILTAVVGVCCGLKLLVVAVGATAFGWVLLWMLERETFTRLLVKGLPHDIVGPSAEAHRRVLSRTGIRILGERKKMLEGQVTFVLATPDGFDRERLEQEFVAGVPEAMRGALDWDVS
jgi:MFS family permease